MAVNLEGIKSAMTWGIFYAMNKDRELSLSKIPEKYAYLKDFIRVAWIDIETWEDLRGILDYEGKHQTPLGLYSRHKEFVGWDDHVASYRRMSDGRSGRMSGQYPVYKIHVSEDFQKVIDEIAVFEKTELREWFSHFNAKGDEQ